MMSETVRTNRFRVTAMVAAVLVLWGFSTIPAAAQLSEARSDRRCLECHSARQYHPAQPGETPPPFIDREQVALSVHGQNGVACVDCHTQAYEVPHPQAMLAYTCEDCHKAETRKYRSSIHGSARAQQITQAAICTDCHGKHDIRAKTDPRSRTHPTNVEKSCLRCHTSDEMARQFHFTRQHIGPDYDQSIHARMLAAGHEHSATCNDCHGSHEILPSRDPQSWVNRRHIPQTCGKCHWIVLGEYQQSIHGRNFAQGSTEAPVCNSCHSDHRVQNIGSDRFKLSIVSECGNCHRDLLKTYRLGYHGKVSQLGGTTTARCSSCHGDHRILPASNPESQVAHGNLVETCGRCHPYANEKFIAFIPHLEVRDRSHPQTFYPWLFMTCLLVATIGFFLLHSVLWLVRESVERVRQQRAPATAANPHPIQYVHRFNVLHRITHLTLFISVIGLALTGLPLRYSETGWARWVFDWLGGYRVAGTLHRFFALLTVVYVGVHFAFLWKQWWRGPKRSLRERVFGPHSMIPNWTDVQQFFQHLRWFLFLGPFPRFGRWTYWEKFDYWAVFWGVVIIGSSGLLMAALPIFGPILPGWMFNVALIIHSEEALLASSFLFLIHFFHVHLRPLRFPMDHVMFTGVVTRREMEEERPGELEVLEAEGRLETLLSDPPSRRSLVLGRILGFVALGIGLALVAGIIAAEIHLHVAH